MSTAAQKPIPQCGLETVGEEQYLLALRAYLDRGGEQALRSAYELGRAAVAEGKGILQFVAMHQAALQKLLSDPLTTVDVAQMLNSTWGFLAEGLSPYEMTHRGFREAVSTLLHLNETLEQEIQRIARAVHDEAGQLAVAVHLALAEVGRDLPLVIRDRLQPVVALLAQIEEQIRRLSHELRQKLAMHRPRTIGQAGRIDGMTPAALTLLVAHLKRKRRGQGARSASGGV